MAKKIVSLYAKQIDTTQPRNKKYTLFDGGGLYIEVSHSISVDEKWKFLSYAYELFTVWFQFF